MIAVTSKSQVARIPGISYTVNNCFLFQQVLVEEGAVVRRPGGMRGPHDVSVVETKAAPLVSELRWRLDTSP